MERTISGIQGLDELIVGGFPKNSTIIVTGGPGCGKSSLCLQFLVQGALQKKEAGLYVSLEEEPDRIVDNIKSSFSWPIDDLVKKKLLKIVRAELYDFDKLKTLIEDEIDKINAKRLVLDPSTVLSLYFEKPLEIRKSLLDLDKMLKKLDCTTLLTVEIPEGKHAISAFGVEEFTADGIIIMYYTKEGNVFTRALTVRKMRATKHDSGIHPIEITKDGIVVYPTEQVFQNI